MVPNSGYLGYKRGYLAGAGTALDLGFRGSGFGVWGAEFWV